MKREAALSPKSAAEVKKAWSITVSATYCSMTWQLSTGETFTCIYVNTGSSSTRVRVVSTETILTLILVTTVSC
jgi:hypothetical protein